MRTAIPTIPSLATLIELDLPGMQSIPDADDEHTTESEVDPRILADAALPISTWETQVMSGPECQDLIAAESEVLAGLGIGEAELAYASGTALAESGLQALQDYDAAFKALPPAATALGDFRALIDAEKREDHTRDLADMRVTITGRLADKSLIADVDAGLSIGKAPWRQLSEIAHGPNVNAGLSARTTAPRRIRTRESLAGSREAFAIVSQDPQRGYAVFDGPQVADCLAAGLRDAGQLSGAKMTLTYDRESTRYDIRAVVQAPVDVPAFSGVGRVHQLFARVSGGDDGNHSISGGLGCLRIRCLNATLVETSIGAWSRRHVGQLGEIRQLVSGLVSSFAEAAASIQGVWSRAAQNHYLDTDGTPLSVREAFTRLVAHGHIPTGGLAADAAVDAFMSAWREEESPTSAAGILMAVQRAAHETTWRTSWAQPELEEAASALLYQPVWALASVEA